MRFKLMPIRRKRFLLICLAIGAFLYLLNSIIKIFSPTMKSLSSSEDCETSPEMRIKMNDLLSQIVSALESLSLTHFLCYYSLWGALKVNSPLKWHSHIDVCLLNEEVLQLDEAFLIRTFKRQGLVISYRSSDGFYLVHANNEEMPYAQLYLFEEDSVVNQYRRVGWKNRIIPPDSCELIHCFPPRLITKPLPTQKFMNHYMPIPREDIEIQKYLFPDSWWKDLEPEHCKNN